MPESIDSDEGIMILITLPKHIRSKYEKILKD